MFNKYFHFFCNGCRMLFPPGPFPLILQGFWRVFRPAWNPLLMAVFWLFSAKNRLFPA
jgi:ABC-type anion transport system duplicated permease subunit